MNETIDDVVVPEEGVKTVMLDAADALLLRSYKKFLTRMGLKEALYCDACWERNLGHGCHARITDHEIFIKCRCKFRLFQGPSL
jgi:hypothetical protein